MLKTFPLDNKLVPVRFVKNHKPPSGVIRDVYEFIDDSSRDLAIVRVHRGKKTPAQKLIAGSRTLHGWMAGMGTLVVTTPSGEKRTFEYRPGQFSTEVTVRVGEIIQWHAHAFEDLTFYEICEPAFDDERFEIV